MNDHVVAIDGPSGSGKSTVARGVASALGMHVLDTGASVVATGNPGCQLQIARGLRDSGSQTRVVHPISLMAAAYRRESGAAA